MGSCRWKHLAVADAICTARVSASDKGLFSEDAAWTPGAEGDCARTPAVTAWTVIVLNVTQLPSQARRHYGSESEVTPAARLAIPAESGPTCLLARVAEWLGAPRLPQSCRQTRHTSDPA